jgi:hypothetical protein
MKSFLKTNFLYRTGNQLRRRDYHIDKEVKRQLSLKDPFLAFRVNFNEARINDETHKMIAAGQRLVNDLTSLHDNLKTDLFMDDPLKIMKPSPERPVSANLLNLAPQAFLLLDKVLLDAALLQSFFQQRLSETIPSQFQIKFQFLGTNYFPVMAIALMQNIMYTSVQAGAFMLMSASFLVQLKRYRAVKNTETEFLRVTKEQLAKAEEMSDKPKIWQG